MKEYCEINFVCFFFSLTANPNYSETVGVKPPELGGCGAAEERFGWEGDLFTYLIILGF